MFRRFTKQHLMTATLNVALMTFLSINLMNHWCWFQSSGFPANEVWSHFLFRETRRLFSVMKRSDYLNHVSVSRTFRAEFHQSVTEPKTIHWSGFCKGQQKHFSASFRLETTNQQQQNTEVSGSPGESTLKTSTIIKYKIFTLKSFKHPSEQIKLQKLRLFLFLKVSKYKHIYFL